MVSICLLAATALVSAPTQPVPLRVSKVMTARVVILEKVETKPLDRAAKNKGPDRLVKRRGDLLLIEYY
jgi:hypothetical protein